MSRNKGLRGEYKLRDSLRAEGYQADRVPSSGAAQGFPGDVAFSKDGKAYLAEVKVRAGNTFRHLYDLLGEADHVGVAVSTPERVWCVDLATSMDQVLSPPGYYPNSTHKGALQALKLFPMLKEAHVLVVRNDHKPFIYIRYR